MSREIINPSEFVQVLIETAKEGDWDTVDDKLVPQLGEMDGETIANELLRHVADESPDARDVVATSFAVLKGLDAETERKIAEAMFRMVKKDPEKYPAGRAAAYLLTLRENPNYRSRVNETLDSFKTRAETEGWRTDLQEAIPVLADVF